MAAPRTLPAWRLGRQRIRSEVNVNSAGLATVVATDNGAHAITASYGTVGPYVNSDTGWITASTTAPISCPSPTIDMKILVVNNAGVERRSGLCRLPGDPADSQLRRHTV